MTKRSESLVIRGEVYVSLSTIAACYDVQLQWVEEVYEFGLLGTGESVGEQIAVAAVKLERMARIVRLHFHYGVNLTGLPGLLDPEE